MSRDAASDGAPRRRRRWVAAMLAGFVVLLVVLEIAARTVAPGPEQLGLFRPSPDARLCFEPVPSRRGVLRVPEPPTPLRFNALGLRGAEVNRARAPGTLRVAVLGASVPFGLGVRDDETLPVMLERELRSRGVRAEVLNLAVPAYTRRQVLARFERDALPLDVQVALVDNSDGDYDREGCLVYDLPAWLREGLLPRSALLRALFLLWDDAGRWEAGSSYRRGEGLRDVVAAMRDFDRVSTQHRVRLGVLVSSIDTSVTPAAVAAFGRMGLPVFDFQPYFPADRDDPFFANRFRNLSGRGSAVLARHIADWMAANGLAPAAPP